MVNKVTLIGNLGRDPEVRRLENGAAVASFSIATSENYQDKEGNWQTQTEWHNIVAWRNRAEQAEKIFKKGSMVYIEGKLTTRKYTDQNNVERYRTEVVANYMRKLKDPDGAGGGGASSSFPTSANEPANTGSFNNAPATPAAPAAPASTGGDSSAADDLPF